MNAPGAISRSMLASACTGGLVREDLSSLPILMAELAGMVFMLLEDTPAHHAPLGEDDQAVAQMPHGADGHHARQDSQHGRWNEQAEQNGSQAAAHGQRLISLAIESSSGAAASVATTFWKMPCLNAASACRRTCSPVNTPRSVRILDASLVIASGRPVYLEAARVGGADVPEGRSRGSLGRHGLAHAPGPGCVGHDGLHRQSPQGPAGHLNTVPPAQAPMFKRRQRRYRAVGPHGTAHAGAWRPRPADSRTRGQ